MHMSGIIYQIVKSGLIYLIVEVICLEILLFLNWILDFLTDK